MNRFQVACLLSVSLHVVAFAGEGLFVFHGPQVEISRGEARVAVIFSSSEPEPLKPLESSTEVVLTQELKTKERDEKVEASSVPPLEEGAEYIQPSYRRNFPPAYPREAFLRNTQGIVWIRLAISPQGKASEVQVEQSSGSSLLDEAALQAAREWAFIPARRAGVAVSTQVRIPIRFQIVEGKPSSQMTKEDH